MNRDVKIAFGGLACIALSMAAILFLLVWRETTAFEPLGDYPEQEVISRLEGYDDPSVFRSDIVVIRGTKCVNSKDPVAVAATSLWRLMEPVGPSVIVPYRNSITVRNHGCVTTEFRNRLPAEVTPGLWRMEGWDTVDSGDGRKQVVAWYTQAFHVVPREEP